jgi:polyisoprenoid-binding protein YceI
MNKLFFLISMMFVTGILHAQDKFFTKTGKINFDATAAQSPEKITAVNKSVTCVMDSKTGNVQFSVLMKGFEFERALMQEHFNENYVESDKFPKAEFKGALAENQKVEYTKDGSYNVKVKGKLTIHGETKEVETDGIITVKAGKINVAATFAIVLADYKVAIPAVVADKVGKTAKISVACALDPLKS